MPAEKLTPEKPKDKSVTIEVPMVDALCPSDFSIHIQFHASPELRRLILMATKALDQKQARLRGGKRVTDPTHAVQWIIEQLHGT